VFIIRIAIIVTGAYILFIGFLFVFQSRYIYFPERILLANPGSVGLDFENVSFETEDGVRLSGWFILKENARGVVLFCHGNAGNISHRLESIQIFHRLRLSVFIFDYRGYGQSEGRPTEQGTYADAKAAWRYLVEERRINPNEIIVFGRSLGGAVASQLAQSHAPGALIVESAFTSLPDIAATIYPYLPVRLLLRFKYNTVEYITKVGRPVLVVHSRDDEIIQELDSSYIIIDYLTATGKFWAIATWLEREPTEYFDIYYLPQENELKQYIHPEYYRSLSVRLYNFDGKAVTPESTLVISYQERAGDDGETFKEVTSKKEFDSYEEAEAYLLSQESANYRIVSENPFASPVPLEALKHYKLVHSSDIGVMVPDAGKVPEVKIFEYIGD